MWVYQRVRGKRRIEPILCQSFSHLFFIGRQDAKGVPKAYHIGPSCPILLEIWGFGPRIDSDLEKHSAEKSTTHHHVIKCKFYMKYCGFSSSTSFLKEWGSTKLESDWNGMILWRPVWMKICATRWAPPLSWTLPGAVRSCRGSRSPSMWHLKRGHPQIPRIHDSSSFSLLNSRGAYPISRHSHMFIICIYTLLNRKRWGRGANSWGGEPPGKYNVGNNSTLTHTHT